MRAEYCRQGAAGHALRLLKDARLAAKQLTNPQDREALHSFRVKVRRLRAFLRSYQNVLGKRLVDKPCKRLGLLIDATNTSRDTQVQRQWLDRAWARRRLSPRARESARWLAARLTAPAADVAQADASGLASQFDKITRQTRRHLDDTVMAHRSKSRPRVFDRCAGEAVLKMADKLQASLDAIKSHDSADSIHRARLVTKRLRYILEPMAKRADTGPAVHDVKGLQDLLGTLRDRQVLQTELARCLSVEAGAWAEELIDQARLSHEASDEQGSKGHQARCLGLRDLIRECEREQHLLFHRLERAWLTDRGEAGLRNTRTIARVLRQNKPTKQTPPLVSAGSSANS